MAKEIPSAPELEAVSNWYVSNLMSSPWLTGRLRVLNTEPTLPPALVVSRSAPVAPLAFEQTGIEVAAAGVRAVKQA
jgi:hypothetical protein